MTRVVLQSAGGTRWEGYIRTVNRARALRLAIEYASDAYPDADGWQPITID